MNIKKSKSLVKLLFTRKANSGFTLIETLITISIVGVIGLMITDLMLRTLKGNTKTQLISQIKQNGQEAMFIIEQAVRFASPVLCTAYDGSSRAIIAIKSQDNKTVRYMVYPATSIANGYITQDYPNTNLIDVTSSANYCTAAANGASSITNQDPINGISIVANEIATGNTNNPTFRLLHNNGANDSVSIKFYVKPGVKAGNNFENKIGGDSGVPFETTIIVR